MGSVVKRRYHEKVLFKSVKEEWCVLFNESRNNVSTASSKFDKEQKSLVPFLILESTD